MKYRPEYHLEQLRRMRPPSAATAMQETGAAELKWLRTLVVDLWKVAPAQRGEQLCAAQRRGVPLAVEAVVLRSLTAEDLLVVLPFLSTALPRLTSLDLRVCDASVITDAWLRTIAVAHRRSLERLWLPSGCGGVSQSTLELFTGLSVLDATRCSQLRSVDFCAGTLRELYASGCVQLDDKGIQNATRLEVLDVTDLKRVTVVTPFARSLLELHCSQPMGDATLSSCHSLQVLAVANGGGISTLRPFGRRLRELYLGFSPPPSLLSDAPSLVRLDAGWDDCITTPPACCASLRELRVRHSGIPYQIVQHATNLVCLGVSYERRGPATRQFLPAGLLELDASGSNLDDAELARVPRLISLAVSDTMTTVEPCAASLRHLVAGEYATLTDRGIAAATQLVTCSVAKLGTIRPFAATLQEVSLGLRSNGREIARAPQLHTVRIGSDILSRDFEGRRLSMLVLRVLQQQLLANGFACISRQHWHRDGTYAPSVDAEPGLLGRRRPLSIWSRMKLWFLPSHGTLYESIESLYDFCLAIVNTSGTGGEGGRVRAAPGAGL